MILIEKISVHGLEEAMRGMRNPMNSWSMADSMFTEDGKVLAIGEKDRTLMRTLRNAGSDHRKFMRMIAVYADITAPLYWWKEFDTYKVGTVANSCSTMHRLTAKEFELSDFSQEWLLTPNREILKSTIKCLNDLRARYLNVEESDDPGLKKVIWYNMIQLLPSSYNQKRTVMMNYEVLANIYKSRKNHKLYEWRDFCCVFPAKLPVGELITGLNEGGLDDGATDDEQ